MTKTDWTSEEVRAEFTRLRTGEPTLHTADLIAAFANRIEADERAVPVAIVCKEGFGPYSIDMLDVDSWALLPHGTGLFTRPPAQAAQVDEHGKCFVDGLGWVVQCSRAIEYAARLVSTAEPAVQGEDEEQLGRDDVTLRLIDAIEERDHLRSVLATQPHSPDAADSGRADGEAVERAAKAMWEVVPRGVPWSDEVTSASEWRMLARAALAAQPQGVADRALAYVFGNMDMLFWKRIVDEKLTPPWPLEHHARAMGLFKAASPVGVPDGWVLVPREPTEPMIEAGYLNSAAARGSYAVRACWPAMLAAAPSATTEGGAK